MRPRPMGRNVRCKSTLGLGDAPHGENHFGRCGASVEVPNKTQRKSQNFRYQAPHDHRLRSEPPNKVLLLAVALWHAHSRKPRSVGEGPDESREGAILIPYRVEHHQVTIRAAARTNTGRVQEHNEDVFSLGVPGLETSYGPAVVNAEITAREIVCGVYDGGEGTTPGTGMMAAQAINDALRSEWSATTRSNLADHLHLAMQAAGRRIFSRAQTEPPRRILGAAATIAVTIENHLKIAHIGHTRAYLQRHGTLTPISGSHTHPILRVWKGELGPDWDPAAIPMPRTLGSADLVDVDLYSLKLHPGDLILLCSDGLTDMLDDPRIRSIVSSAFEPASICEALIHAAEQEGGVDNVTAIVAIVDSASGG